MRPSLVNTSETIAGDQSNQFGLLTERKFCRKLSRSISIDSRYCNRLFTSEDRNCLWITALPLPRRCLQSRQQSGSRMRGVTLALSGAPNLRPELDQRYFILYCFINPLRPQNYILPSVRSVVPVQTQLQYIQSSWETLFFSESGRTSNPPLFLVGHDSWWRQAAEGTSLVIAQWLEHSTCSRKDVA